MTTWLGSRSASILIDGAHLVRLLFEHGVGVRTKRTYEVKEVDDEYFLDD